MPPSLTALQIKSCPLSAVNTAKYDISARVMNKGIGNGKITNVEQRKHGVSILNGPRAVYYYVPLVKQSSTNFFFLFIFTNVAI